MCDNGRVTATTTTLHPLIAAARAAADADPNLHNGHNDCDDAYCVPCGEALDELERLGAWVRTDRVAS